MSETRAFYYTDKLDTPHSSAVSNIWYSADTREVFVRFNSGNIAGYSHFDPAYWDEVRRAYRRGDSIGRLVATHIKGMFPGVCGDIDPQPKTYTDTAESIPSEPSNAPFYDFEVEVTITRTVTVRSTSVEAAKAKVLASAEQSDGTVSVTAVTQYFGN